MKNYFSWSLRVLSAIVFGEDGEKKKSKKIGQEGVVTMQSNAAFEPSWKKCAFVSGCLHAHLVYLAMATVPDAYDSLNFWCEAAKQKHSQGLAWNG